MLELGIAVRVAASLIGLGIALTAEAEVTQKAAHRIGRDRVTHGAQRRSQFLQALGNPE